MKCDICKKNEATIHQTIIINGHKEEMHYCEECSQKAAAGFKKTFSMEDFFGAFLGQQNDTAKPTCKSCGMTIDTFKNTGRLGCENCYNDLREYILPVIESVHGRTVHVGKSPGRDIVVNPLKELDEIAKLNGELKKAIEIEDYENAAVLRDRIKELKDKN